MTSPSPPSVLRLIANVTAILSMGWYFLRQFQDAHASLSRFLADDYFYRAGPADFFGGDPAGVGEVCRGTSARAIWPLLRLAHFLFWPVVRVLNIFDEIVRRLAGVSLMRVTPGGEACGGGGDSFGGRGRDRGGNGR